MRLQQHFTSINLASKIYGNTIIFPLYIRSIVEYLYQNRAGRYRYRHIIMVQI